MKRKTKQLPAPSKNRLEDTSTAKRSRQQQLEDLYFQNYTFLLDTALSDRRLLGNDGERIAQGIADHLHSYTGPLSDESFQAWAADIIKPAVDRIGTLYELRDRYACYVRGAIRKTLSFSNKFDDLNAVVDELENDVWIWAASRIESFMTPGTAAISTRLYGRAEWIATVWLTKQIIRLEAVKLHLSQGGVFEDCETLPELELASIRADEQPDHAAM